MRRNVYYYIKCECNHMVGQMFCSADVVVLSFYFEKMGNKCWCLPWRSYCVPFIWVWHSGDRLRGIIRLYVSTEWLNLHWNRWLNPLAKQGVVVDPPLLITCHVFCRHVTYWSAQCVHTCQSSPLTCDHVLCRHVADFSALFAYMSVFSTHLLPCTL